MLVSALLLCALAAQSPDAPPTSLVLGRVVDAATGRGIAGAILALTGSALPPRSRDTAPRVMTNADGQFVIRGLRRGVLFLNVTRPGYLDATNEQRRPMGSTQPLEIEDGQRLTNIVVRMWRPGIITGTVVDEAGEPLIGVNVQAYSATLVAGHRRFDPGAMRATDDRGQYRISGLVPGEYAIAVATSNVSVPASALDMFFGGDAPPRTRTDVSREMGTIGAAVVPPGSALALSSGDQVMTLPPGSAAPAVRADGSLLVYPTLFYPAARSVSQATLVAVRSGEERSGVDLQLMPVAAVRVSGTVVAPDGPASYTAVRLLPVPSDRLRAPVHTAATVTDDAGNFTFPAVPAGQYVLSVLREPRTPADPGADAVPLIQSGGLSIRPALRAAPGTVVPEPPPPDPTWYAQMTLVVGNRGLSGILVPLQPCPRVSGRVEFDGTSDRPTSRQIQNIRIALEPADGTDLPLNLSFETGRPGGDGLFRTSGVPPGRYFVRVTNAIEGWAFRGAFAGGRDLADTPIDLQNDLTDVALTFTDRPSGIGGVARAGQEPDPGAIVIAFPVDASAWIDNGASQRRLRTSRARKDGTFTFPWLPPGEYYVVAVHEDTIGEAYDPALLQSLATTAQQVRLVDGERKVVNIRTVGIR